MQSPCTHTLCSALKSQNYTRGTQDSFYYPAGYQIFRFLNLYIKYFSGVVSKILCYSSSPVVVDMLFMHCAFAESNKTLNTVLL